MHRKRHEQHPRHSLVPRGGIVKLRRKPKTQTAMNANHRHLFEAAGGAIGALSGAGLGMMAGPPGMAVGAVIGGVVGALTSWALDANAVDFNAHERELDATIGVSGGDIGVDGLQHPPPERGTYSAAAMGVGASEEATAADGPILPPPD